MAAVGFLDALLIPLDTSPEDPSGLCDPEESVRRAVSGRGREQAGLAASCKRFFCQVGGLKQPIPCHRLLGLILSF